MERFEGAEGAESAEVGREWEEEGVRGAHGQTRRSGAMTRTDSEKRGDGRRWFQLSEGTPRLDDSESVTDDSDRFRVSHQLVPSTARELLQRATVTAIDPLRAEQRVTAPTH